MEPAKVGVTAVTAFHYFIHVMVWSGDTLDMSITFDEYLGAVPLKVKSGK